MDQLVPRQTNSGIARRTFVKLAGLGFAAGALAGAAGAHGDDGHTPGSFSTAAAYTVRDGGRLSEVGVHFPASDLSGLPERPTDVPAGVPFSVSESLDFGPGDTARFEFVTFDWNPEGHEPEGIYTAPHFDFHFYMLPEADVAAIPPGPATYDIPAPLVPAHTVTADALGAPRDVVPGMGEHLVDVTAPELQHLAPPFPDPIPFTTTYIWGAYDPDGDGTGHLIFAEPMMTLDYLTELRGDGSADQEDARPVPMPERFLEAGWYPTEYVTRYLAGDDSFTVSLESFEQFAGYGRRHEHDA